MIEIYCKFLEFFGCPPYKGAIQATSVVVLKPKFEGYQETWHVTFKRGDVKVKWDHSWRWLYDDKWYFVSFGEEIVWCSTEEVVRK